MNNFIAIGPEYPSSINLEDHPNLPQTLRIRVIHHDPLTFKIFAAWTKIEGHLSFDVNQIVVSCIFYLYFVACIHINLVYV